MGSRWRVLKYPNLIRLVAAAPGGRGQRLEWPHTTYHRTVRSAWKAIVQYGILVGGGSKSVRAKAHEYMSEYHTSDDRYQSGQRRQNLIELEIDIRSAIADGLICFRTEAGSIMTAMDVPPKYIVSITDTDERRVLWHKDLEAPSRRQEGYPASRCRPGAL